jgi:hypothetical protein
MWELKLSEGNGQRQREFFKGGESQDEYYLKVLKSNQRFLVVYLALMFF